MNVDILSDRDAADLLLYLIRNSVTLYIDSAQYHRAPEATHEAQTVLNYLTSGTFPQYDDFSNLQQKFQDRINNAKGPMREKLQLIILKMRADKL